MIIIYIKFSLHSCRQNKNNWILNTWIPCSFSCSTEMTTRKLLLCGKRASCKKELARTYHLVNMPNFDFDIIHTRNQQCKVSDTWHWHLLRGLLALAVPQVRRRFFALEALGCRRCEKYFSRLQSDTYAENLYELCNKSWCQFSMS